MTLPDERSRAIMQTRAFLRELLDPKKTPRVPRAIRHRAYYCLKHYPFYWNINDVADDKNFSKLKVQDYE